MNIALFASGSSGNCALVSDGETHILIDAGISARRIRAGLTAQDVAMPTEALIILNLVRARGNAPRIFGLAPETTSAIWRKIRNRAGLGPVTDSEGRLVREGLNFHDSRATFATWAASPNPKTGAPRLDVLALARQTGHKNLAMLQRYYRPSAEDIAKRLDE